MKFLILLCTSLMLFSEEAILFLGELGSFRYHVEDALLIQIDRLSLEGEIISSHKYHYNNEGFVISEEQAPPFTWEDLGWDSSKCPGEGFVCKKKGTPESGNGNWVKGEKDSKERLNPDLKHDFPHGPPWDYHGPNFPKGVRINRDGTRGHK